MIVLDFPILDLVATGHNIATLRKRAGMSVKQLQNIFGFSTPQAVYKWQTGEHCPTVDNLIVLSSVFGVKIDDIIVCK